MSLTAKQQKEAQQLYEEFWAMNPTQPNPSDINTPEKANFLMLKGFERVRLMQKARKQGLEFTKL